MQDDTQPPEGPPTLEDLDNAPPAIPVQPGDVQVTAEDYASRLARVTAVAGHLPSVVSLSRIAAAALVKAVLAATATPFILSVVHPTA